VRIEKIYLVVAEVLVGMTISHRTATRDLLDFLPRWAAIRRADAGQRGRR